MENHDYAIHLADVEDGGTLVEVLDGGDMIIGEQTEVDGGYSGALEHASKVIVDAEAAQQG